MATGPGKGSWEHGVRVPGLGGTVCVIGAAASGREGGRVTWGVAEGPGAPRVATWAPQAVRAATAVSPMKPAVRRRMVDIAFSSERADLINRSSTNCGS